MKTIPELLKAYMDTHPFETGDSGCQSVLEQLYQIHSESHENDPLEIRESFSEWCALRGGADAEATK